MLGRLRLLVGIDARRAASWLALTVAAAAAWLLADMPPAARPSPPVTAVVAGALLAVMVIGDAAAKGHEPALDIDWLAERAAWPMLGWLVVAGGRGTVPLLAGGGAGIALGAALVATLGRRGLLAADAASAAIVAASCAGAVGWWADSTWPVRMPGGGIAVGLLIGATAAAGAVMRLRPVGTATSVRSTARHLLTAAAMMGAMAGMVGWLFLAAGLARFDLVASLAWFVALAVPAATLGDGVSHAIVWRRCERAAPRRGGGRLQPARANVRGGVQAAVTTAALLCWPPLVAAALSGGDAERTGGSLVVVAAIVSAAVVLLVIVGLGQFVRATPDTQLAVAISVTCLVLAGTAAAGCRWPPDLPARPFVGW